MTTLFLSAQPIFPAYFASSQKLLEMNRMRSKVIPIIIFLPLSLLLTNSMSSQIKIGLDASLKGISEDSNISPSAFGIHGLTTVSDGDQILRASLEYGSKTYPGETVLVSKYTGFDNTKEVSIKNKASHVGIGFSGIWTFNENELDESSLYSSFGIQLFLNKKEIEITEEYNSDLFIFSENDEAAMKWNTDIYLKVGFGYTYQIEEKIAIYAEPVFHLLPGLIFVAKDPSEIRKPAFLGILIGANFIIGSEDH